MRTLYVLVLLIFSFFSINAQITLEEEPLETNPTLQRLHKQSEDAHNQKLRRLFGNTASVNSRNLSIICDEDGIFKNGDIVYVVSGDSVRVCLDTIGYATMTNISVDGNFGTTSIDTNCVVYHSFIYFRSVTYIFRNTKCRCRINSFIFWLGNCQYYCSNKIYCW